MGGKFTGTCDIMSQTWIFKHKFLCIKYLLISIAGSQKYAIFKNETNDN